MRLLLAVLIVASLAGCASETEPADPFVRQEAPASIEERDPTPRPVEPEVAIAEPEPEVEAEPEIKPIAPEVLFQASLLEGRAPLYVKFTAASNESHPWTASVGDEIFAEGDEFPEIFSYTFAEGSYVVSLDVASEPAVHKELIIEVGPAPFDTSGYDFEGPLGGLEPDSAEHSFEVHEEAAALSFGTVLKQSLLVAPMKDYTFDADVELISPSGKSYVFEGYGAEYGHLETPEPGTWKAIVSLGDSQPLVYDLGIIVWDADATKLEISDTIVAGSSILGDAKFVPDVELPASSPARDEAYHGFHMPHGAEHAFVQLEWGFGATDCDDTATASNLDLTASLYGTPVIHSANEAQCEGGVYSGRLGGAWDFHVDVREGALVDYLITVYYD